MVMEKKLIERITRSHSELWRYDCNHLKVSSGLAASEYEFRGMAVLSEEAAEKEAPAVKRLVKTCYERDYFQTRAAKKCIYMAGTPVAADLRRRIGMKYFRNPAGRGSRYDPLKRQAADNEYLIFPDTLPENARGVPLALVSDGAVIGDGLWRVADPTLWDCGILASEVFAEWMKTVGSLGLYDCVCQFPFPPQREGDCEVMERFLNPLRRYWETGQEMGLSEALETLNGYVDSLYRERCPIDIQGEPSLPESRILYLLALRDKRGSAAKIAREGEAYNSRNVLAHPDVPRISLPTLLTILNSKEPVQPEKLGENLLSRAQDPYGSLKTLVKKGYLRRVETERTTVDKNGKKRNTAYESDVEYTGFFVEWIKFYLPEDPEQRSRAWELALLPSKERNPQFPGGSEYKTLKILWSAEKPLMKKEIKAERGMPETIDRLLEKGLVEERKGQYRRYRPLLSEVDFHAAVIREILSRMDERKNAVISMVGQQIGETWLSNV